MAAFNKVMLMGNLTRDVELKYTPSGMAVARMGMAVSRKFRDTKTNELREDVCFVDIDVFGKQAETAHQYLSKGKPLFVEGRLKFNQWDDKTTGKKTSKLTVVCDHFQFLGAGGGGAAAGGAPGAAPARTASRPLPNRPAPGGGGDVPAHDFANDQEPQENLDIPADDIPF